MLFMVKLFKLKQYAEKKRHMACGVGCFSWIDRPDVGQSGRARCGTLSQNSENLSAFRQIEG